MDDETNTISEEQSQIIACSSITQLSDATDLSRSYMLVSEPCEEWDTYQSKKAPLSVIGKNIISTSNARINYLESVLDMISSALSNAITIQGQNLVVRTKDNPYIISSIYESHGSILSIDGYSLSDQVQVAPEIFEKPKPIATVVVGSISTQINIPNDPTPTTHIITYDTNMQQKRTQTRDLVLNINVMSESSYILISNNTSVDDQGQFFAYPNANGLFVHSHELYLVSEEEIIPDPTITATLLITDGTESDNDTSDETTQNSQSGLMTAENPSSSQDDSIEPSDGGATTVQNSSAQTVTDDNDDDDETGLIGHDLHDFDDVTFLDVTSRGSIIYSMPDVTSTDGTSDNGTSTDGTSDDGTSDDGTSTDGD